MNLTLYEISETLQALVDSLDMCETDEQRAQCEAEIQQTVRVQMGKTDDFCRFLAHLESQEGLASAEIDRLWARRHALTRTRERLEQYAIHVLQSMNLQRIDGATSRLSLRRNPPAVEIFNEAALPGKFKTVVQEVKIDKKAIKEAIQGGADVPGANLRSGISLSRR